MTQLLPPKKEVALALLERSNVDVYLDPRARGVVVPPQFRKEPRLILKIGLNMPVPIPDLRLDDESMSCTLSFSRTPFYCVVPWPSVFAMVGEDGRGMVWPDDVPQELAVKVVEPGTEGPRVPGAGDRESQPSPSGRGRAAKKSAGVTMSDERGEPSRAGGAAGSKKGKKKKDEGRPMLVAVPSSQRAPSAEAAGEAGASGGAEEKREKPAARRPEAPPPSTREPGDAVSAVPSSRSPSPPSQRPGVPRPKRELPPYLRVVK